ncbi:hypothetical protein Tco_0838735 [Tanacetum coccineum]|uniref:Uncharacterized protein n=1 Tax=Tanacetum coccineum TaxID=301880 RepID=A0ABQ5ASQ9_9ASTR
MEQLIKEIGMAVVLAVTKSRGMKVAGAVDSYLVGEDIRKVNEIRPGLWISKNPECLLRGIPYYTKIQSIENLCEEQWYERTHREDSHRHGKQSPNDSENEYPQRTVSKNFESYCESHNLTIRIAFIDFLDSKVRLKESIFQRMRLHEISFLDCGNVNSRHIKESKLACNDLPPGCGLASFS